jgi:NAD(P)-dependent dehydrogenase (short-subunit alcohol dehydrogenase family)
MVNTTRQERRFQEHNYLIVGGSSGIGLATASRVADEGGRVIMLGRNADRLASACSSLRGSGHRACEVDAGDEEKVREFMSSLREQDQVLHGAVFCSGAHALRPAKISRQSHYQAAITSNLFSITNFIPGVLPLAAPGAALVLVSSAAIIRGGAAVSAYVAAKNAVIGLGRSLALELAPKLRVNTVLPGVVTTSMTQRFFDTIGTAGEDQVRRRHPLGVGTADHVAAAICFLLSSDASWITGTELAVDGGFAIGG